MHSFNPIHRVSLSSWNTTNEHNHLRYIAMVPIRLIIRRIKKRIEQLKECFGGEVDEKHVEEVSAGKQADDVEERGKGGSS